MKHVLTVLVPRFVDVDALVIKHNILTVMPNVIKPLQRQIQQNIIPYSFDITAWLFY